MSEQQSNGAPAVEGLSERTRAKWAAASTPEKIAANLPPMLDLTIENITENVMKINSMCDNPRLRYLILKLIQAAHDYVREVGLQFDEWEQAWEFLTKVGQISTDVRHEFVLLSDILGISALVDAISYPAVPGATESSVLGPFHDEEAHSFQYGESIFTEGTPGEPTIVRGWIKDTDGNTVPKALIDVWETDGNGVYDLEHDGNADPNCRGKIFSNEKGEGPLPLPHMHFMIEHPKYTKLITALYSRDSNFVESDTVFGVKKSLIVGYKWCEDLELAKEHTVTPIVKTIDGKESTGFWLLEQDFVLVKKSPPPPRKTED
ncbi:aromatic compound dioxygenase [Aspergillus homomorphus CBS 101889]|uniref:Aromatic compound dioxygenase n=1 Tax=Aspergillus homomorphus (strain CBS 101889) TaxID=1450537 RepID=A0A395HXS1_ASPHC|nr:aromatic compound dioxygenase [Aspergillus homomorphus CBS 101889]RAL12326.1 aromatic compound dioxygenase [Aspergillus homomorphus CBS 101889]